MALKLYQESDIAAIAAAIRSKTGGSDTYTAAQMAQAITDIPAGGGGDIDALIDGSIDEVTTSASSIRNYTFHGCTSLRTLSAPQAQSVGFYAMYSCDHLREVSLPAATSIGAYAMSGCLSLRTVNAPLITAIPNYLCQGDTQLTAADFPAATSIGSDAFYNCRAMTEVNFPAVTAVYSSAFDGCRALTKIDLPAVQTMEVYAIRNCPALTEAILGDLRKIDIMNFQYDTALNTLVLRRSDAITSLGNINAFNSTPFASGGRGGTLYVPQALLSTYQSATNWVTILGYTNNRILPIEGSAYEE